MTLDPKAKAYFQTTKMSDEELVTAQVSARRQEIRIAAYFVRLEREMSLSQYGMSPSDVWLWVFTEEIPLTSVRRAMTQLTRRGFLTKTDVLVNGQYGKPEHLWKLSDAAIRAMRPDYKQLELSDLLPA